MAGPSPPSSVETEFARRPTAEAQATFEAAAAAQQAATTRHAAEANVPAAASPPAAAAVANESEADGCPALFKVAAWAVAIRIVLRIVC